jgi:hypothetical protein
MRPARFGVTAQPQFRTAEVTAAGGAGLMSSQLPAAGAWKKTTTAYARNRQLPRSVWRCDGELVSISAGGRVRKSGSARRRRRQC